MGRIITTKELFEEEEKKGEEQRQRGIKPLKPVSLSSPVGELTLEDVEEPAPDKPKGLLDVLNEDIEKNYHEYIKLEKVLGEFDTTLADVPQSIKPSIIANYNKVVNKFNTLVTTLQADVKKRDEILLPLKKEYVKAEREKRMEGSEVQLKEHQRPAMLDLDRANKYIAAPLKGILHGIYSTPQAVGGLMRLVGENMEKMEGTPNIFLGDETKYTDLMKAIAKRPDEDSTWSKSISKTLIDKSQEIIDWNRTFLKSKDLRPDMDDKTAAWLFQLGSGATSLAGAIGIAVLTHSPHAAAVAFGMYQTGSMYQEAREEDVGVGKATGLAITAGVIEGALEYVGLQWLFTKFGGNFWVEKILHAALEGFQEFSQQLGENLIAIIGWDKLRSLWQGTGESASIGAVLGVGASAIFDNVDKNIDLKNLTDKQKKGLVEAIVNKQLEAITKIIPNLNPKTIMEKVKTDPDIQKAILGVFEAEQESETVLAAKTEPKEPVVEAYHGTNTSIKKVSELKINKESDQQFYGSGIYYSLTKEGASQYGKNILKTKIDTSKLLDLRGMSSINRQANTGTVGTYEQYLDMIEEEDTDKNFEDYKERQQEVKDDIIKMGYEGVVDNTQIVVFKTEPKPPTTPKELEAKREVLREHGIKEELLADDEFVKKAKITELPKADVTSEQVSEKLIEDLEKKWGKETKLTKKEVLEKVEKPPKVEPKEPIVPKDLESQAQSLLNSAKDKFPSLDDKVVLDTAKVISDKEGSKKIRPAEISEAISLGIGKLEDTINEITLPALLVKKGGTEIFQRIEELGLSEEYLDKRFVDLVDKIKGELVKFNEEQTKTIKHALEREGNFPEKIKINHLKIIDDFVFDLKTGDEFYGSYVVSTHDNLLTPSQKLQWKVSAKLTELRNKANEEAKKLIKGKTKREVKTIQEELIKKYQPELDKLQKEETKFREKGYKELAKRGEEISEYEKEKLEAKPKEPPKKPPVPPKKTVEMEEPEEPTKFQEFKDNVRDSFGIVIGENPDSEVTLYSPTPTSEIIVGTKGKSEAQKIGEALHEIGHLTTMDEGTYFPELMGRDKFLATELDAYKWAIDNSSKFGINPEIVMDIMPESFKNKYSEEIEQYLQIKVKKAPKEVALEEEPKFRKDVKIKEIYEEKIEKQKEKYEKKIEKIIEKFEKRIEILKGKAKERLQKRIDKLKEHYKEIKARAKERAAQKKYVNKLIKDINKLPTQNVAVDYRDKIEAIKDMYDLKKRQKKTLHAREETAKFIEREMEAGNTNLNIPQEIIDLIKKKPLNDMTIAELEDIHDTIIQLAHIGKTKGKMIKLQKGREIDELVENLIDVLYQGKKIPTGRNIKQEMRDILSLKKKVKDTWSHYWINTTLDEALFERIDGGERGLWTEVFYDAVNKCKNDELLDGFKRIEDSQNFIAENKIDIVKFLQERMGDLMLTPSQRVGVYLCSLDEDAKRHIQNAGVYLMKGMKEPYKFTDNDISDVADNLTKEEKAMAKHYQEYQLTQEKELDEFDVRVRGVHLKGVKNRFAIQILNEDMDNSEAIELERNPTSRRAYMEEGFRKTRTHRAENVINIDSVSNMLRDIAKVGHYKAYKETEMDINNLLSDPKLKNAIINHPKLGRIAYDNIVQWFKDSIKAKQSKILSTSDKALMFLRTSAFISMLGINILSGTKQLVSLCNAVAETNLTTILSGIEQVALHYNDTKQFVFQRDPQMRARKGQIDKIMREWMQTADAKQMLTGKTQDIRMKTLFLIRTLDEFAVLSVWKGTFDQTIHQGKSEKEAIKRASEVMRKTQPAALTKDLPQWFRDGTVANLFSLFQNQINKNQNYIRHDMFGKLKAGKISPGKFAHRVLWGWFLPAVLIGTITRGRPPEDWKELARDIATYYAGGWFFVGSIAVNIMQGYGGWMPAPLSFGEEFVKAATYKTMESKFKHGISGTCKIIGLPYNQPYRTIEGVEDWLLGETDDVRRLIWTQYVLDQGEKKYTLVKGKPGKPKKLAKPAKPKKPSKPGKS